MNRAEEKRKRLRRLAIRMFLIPIGILALFFFFLFFFRVKEVEVVGNEHYTDAEIRSMVMGEDPLTQNTLLLSYLKRTDEFNEKDFIHSIDIKMTGRNSIRIEVSEKVLVGYLYAEDAYWYFDERGEITVRSYAKEVIPADFTEEQYIPYVTGLPLTDPGIGEFITPVVPDLFSTLDRIRIMINKTGLIPDAVELQEDQTFALLYKDVRVLLGDASFCEQQMQELPGILPSVLARAGTLHLENYDGTQDRIIFSPDEY